MPAPAHPATDAASPRARRVAIAISDVPSQGAWALEMAAAWQQRGATTDLWGHGADGMFRRRCRQAGVQWHALPPALMDGSLDSRRYLARLLSGLTRAKPDLVIGTGVPAGVGCGIMWRAAGARCGIWCQPDARSMPVSPRALRMAVAWTPLAWAATKDAARLLIETLGVPAEGVTVSDVGADPVRACAGWADALKDAYARRSPATRFAPHLIIRAVVPHIIEQEEQAAGLVAHLQRTGVRRVAVYGDGSAARILVDACQRRHLSVVGLVPLVEGGHEPAGRRMALTDVFRRGARVVAIASREGRTNVAGRVRQVGRAHGVAVTVVAVGHPGFVVTAPSGGDRTPVLRALSARSLRDIDRRVGPIIAALRRDRVRTCCIYGASDVGRAILRLARRHRIRVPFFVDGSDAKWGEVVDGVEIVSLAQIASTGPRTFAIGSIANAAPISAAIAAACQTPDTRVYAAQTLNSGSC